MLLSSQINRRQGYPPKFSAQCPGAIEPRNYLPVCPVVNVSAGENTKPTLAKEGVFFFLEEFILDRLTHFQIAVFFWGGLEKKKQVFY